MRVTELIAKLQAFKDKKSYTHPDFDPEVKISTIKKYGDGDVVVSLYEDIVEITMSEYLSLSDDKITIRCGESED